jgi:hypothetical protein
MSLYFTLNTYKTTTIPVFRSVVIIPSADAEGDRCYIVAYKWDRDLLETETVYSLDEAISTAKAMEYSRNVYGQRFAGH